MVGRRVHRVPHDPAHHDWDAEREPVLAIASGDTIEVETLEVTDDQVAPTSTADDLTRIDETRLYPLVGPVHVDGARPGDTLAIEVLEIETADWGWTGIFPGEVSSHTTSPTRISGSSTSAGGTRRGSATRSRFRSIRSSA